jgi:hypothetical protein
MSSATINGIKTDFGYFDITMTDKPEPRVVMNRFSATPRKKAKSEDPAGCSKCGGVAPVVWPKLLWQGTPKPVRIWNWLKRKPKTKYQGCGCFLPFLKLNDWLLVRYYFPRKLTFVAGTPRV